MTRLTTQLIVALTALSITGSTVMAGSSCQRRGRNTCPPPRYESPADEEYEEDFEDEEFELELKPVDCEVQVQHPLTFDWVTVQTFGDEEQAQAYAERIEQRYWILYRSPGSRQTEFEEAATRSDANSKTSSLRRAGKNILEVTPVVAQVVEMPLLSLFDSQSLLEDEPELFDDVRNPPEAAPEAGPPPAPNDMEALLGLWEAVTEDADGNVQRLLLDLNADGTAVLTVPTPGGGEARVERPFMIEDGEFKLADEENELVLGVVIEADADLVVLERPEGQIRLTRP